MTATLTRLCRALLPALFFVALAGCAPATDETSGAEPAGAANPASRYVSTKQVSSDCGVEVTPAPPPGFEDRSGGTFGEMPPVLVKRQAVGANRPIAATQADKVSPGYVLIEPAYRKPAYIIDNDKQVVASFENDYYSFTQLLPDGSRLASSDMWSEVFWDGGGNRGCIEEYGPDGRLNYRWRLATDRYIHHHDVIKLPNGNLLALVWEDEPVAHAIELGRNPELVAENGHVWYDGIVELDPASGDIVWEWSMRHHLVQDFDPAKPNYGVVANHPGRLDINAVNVGHDGTVGDDWTHVNALDYNPGLDQIVFSSNYLSEVFIIDHASTPYEAQGRAGDFLWRWGNPANYDRGTADDRTLFKQHDAHWIRPGLDGAGNLLIFNNGDDGARAYSSVVEVAPVVNADGSYAVGEGKLAWEYAPQDEDIFFSWFISGAQRLENGNTLVNHGAAARVRELTRDGEIVWEYQYEDGNAGPHMLFRANKYSADHPGIQALLRQADE